MPKVEQASILVAEKKWDPTTNLWPAHIHMSILHLNIFPKGPCGAWEMTEDRRNNRSRRAAGRTLAASCVDSRDGATDWDFDRRAWGGRLHRNHCAARRPRGLRASGWVPNGSILHSCITTSVWRVLPAAALCSDFPEAPPSPGWRKGAAGPRRMAPES